MQTKIKNRVDNTKTCDTIVLSRSSDKGRPNNGTFLLRYSPLFCAVAMLG
nr:MAG TPA: hypothetical protein [Caudoviricetes sp.]